MAFVPVPNTAQFELVQVLDGQRIENTLYAVKTAPWTAAELETECDALASWWTTNMAPIISDQVTLVTVEGTSMESNTAPVGANTTGTPSVGLQGTPVPNNCALAVSFRTALRGRSFRGRNFVAGLAEADVNRSHVDATLVGQIQDAYNVLLDTFTDAIDTAGWCVVSRFSGVDGSGHPIPRTTGIATRVTSAIVVDDVIDSQRRRLPGRGD